VHVVLPVFEHVGALRALFIPSPHWNHHCICSHSISDVRQHQCGGVNNWLENVWFRPRRVVVGEE